MPWDVRKNDEGKFCVYKKGSTTPVPGGCHETQSEARDHQKALYADVKEMSGELLSLHTAIPLTFAAPDSEPQWMLAIPYGDYKHPLYDEFSFSEVNADNMIEHFRAGTTGMDTLLDFEHGVDQTKGKRASGKVLDMRKMPDGIHWLVEWTKEAVQEIRDGAYRYFSPEYFDLWEDNSGGLHQDVATGGGLTNKPWFQGMPALNFSSLMEDESWQFAVWTTKYINDLPDSAFLYVESGEKDSEGKTVPRSKRHFPYKDSSGNIDLPHLRNAIARIPQSNVGNKEALQKKAQNILARVNKKGSVHESDLDLDPETGEERNGMNEYLKKLLSQLGIEVKDDMTDEQAEELIAKKFSAQEDELQPLRDADKEARKRMSFREQYPDEYERMVRLEEADRETRAKTFSSRYEKFRVKTTNSEGEERTETVPRGFSALVLQKVEDAHKKLSRREFSSVELEELLDSIASNGIVDYTESGSSRVDSSGSTSRDDVSGTGVRKQFASLVRDIQEKDNLPQRDAIVEAARRDPDLYERYMLETPRR